MVVRVWGRRNRELHSLDIGFYLGNKMSLLRKTQSDTVNSDESITAERLLNVLSQMPDDFYEEETTDEPPQEREEL